MDKSYKRIENIDEKIQKVKLSYAGWRTLFLIDEETPASKISEILSEEPANVNVEIDHLLEAGLIMELEATEPDTKADAEKIEEVIPVSEAETKEEPEDMETAEVPIIEEEPEESPADQVEEADEPKNIEDQLEEFPASEEVFSELPDEKIDLKEEDETIFMEEKDAEEAVLEEEVPAEEDLEINIHDESQTESGMLDVDFGEEPAKEEPEKEEQSKPEPVVETPAPAAPDAQGEPSVLVVDDSIVIRKMVEIALENEGLAIHTAVSGKDGLDKIDQLSPALIILDLMLPDINGIDILKTVKASRNIPVIMLSGKDSPQMVEKAKEAGADAFLPKPFKDDELKEQIKALLEA